jgi:hypothetical protein
MPREQNDDLNNNEGKSSRGLTWGTIAGRDYRQQRQQQQQQIWVASVLTEKWTGCHLSQFARQDTDVGGKIILKLIWD